MIEEEGHEGSMRRDQPSLRAETILRPQFISKEPILKKVPLNLIIIIIGVLLFAAGFAYFLAWPSVSCAKEYKELECWRS